MAGSITQELDRRGNVGVITLTATGDASNGSFPAVALIAKISGKLLALETNPGATSPTSLYDIALDDAEGHDVLEGAGANLHATNTEKSAVLLSSLHPPVAKSDVLTLKITNNSVNSAIIVIKIYYEGSAEA